MDTNAPPGRSPDSDNEESDDPDPEGDIPSAYGPIAMDVINDYNHVVPGERNNWPSASSMAAFTSSNSATGTVEEMARSRSLPIQDNAADRNNESAIVTEIRTSTNVISNDLRQLTQAILNIAFVPSTNQRPPDQSPPDEQVVHVPPGDVRNEAYRFFTFHYCPRIFMVSVLQLAKQGFFYTGYIDRVKCYSCGSTVEKFNSSDSSNYKRYHKGNCLMAQGRAPDNIPCINLQEVTGGHDANTANTAVGENTQVRPTGNVDPVSNIQNGPFLNAEPISNTRQWRLRNIISPDHKRYILNLHLNREIDRLATFSHWPIARPNVAPVDVARAGFFYLGDMDRTQCFSCGGVLRNWTIGDNAMDDHRAHFPNCKFVLGTDRRNVPVPLILESQEQLTVNYPCRHPTNPHMRSESKRLLTFDSRWPCGKTTAAPQQIAEAGFFYYGERDRVKCWYCNGGLQNWEYDDLPWVKHAKWFPSCQFLLNRKGQRFVYRHLSASSSMPRPVIDRQLGATIDPV